MFKAVKKQRSRTGEFSDWRFGQGYVRDTIRIMFNCWCVVDGEGRLWCDAASKSKAEAIAFELNEAERRDLLSK